MKFHTDPDKGLTCVIFNTTERKQLAHVKSLLTQYATGDETLPAELYSAIVASYSCIGKVLKTNGKKPDDDGPEYKGKTDDNPMDK